MADGGIVRAFCIVKTSCYRDNAATYHPPPPHPTTSQRCLSVSVFSRSLYWTADEHFVSDFFHLSFISSTVCCWEKQCPLCAIKQIFCQCKIQCRGWQRLTRRQEKYIQVWLHTFKDSTNVWLASKSQSESIRYLHLEVSDEPLHSDFLFDLQEEAVAAQHHALQDVQGHLLYWRVGRLGVDEAGNLTGDEGQKGWREGGG